MLTTHYRKKNILLSHHIHFCFLWFQKHVYTLKVLRHPCFLFQISKKSKRLFFKRTGENWVGVRMFLFLFFYSLWVGVVNCRNHEILNSVFHHKTEGVGGELKSNIFSQFLQLHKIWTNRKRSLWRDVLGEEYCVFDEGWWWWRVRMYHHWFIVFVLFFFHPAKGHHLL